MQKLMTLKFCDCFSETKQMAVIGKKTNKQKKKKKKNESRELENEISNLTQP